jgi:lipid-A-disaccharide synthase
MSTTIMVIAGEVSGDMHAARLVAAVRERRPDITVFGVGGPDMRAAGVETLVDIKDMAVMGFIGVLRRFRFFARVMKSMKAAAETRKPDAVILVDYPGFNIRFAAHTHALGLKNIYYICPQVWAWNRSRIPKMAAIVDRLIAIFPFEPKVFEGSGLTTDFVGHPLVDEARKALAAPDVDLGWEGEPRVALLPGSRIHEVHRILPTMWEAARRIQEAYPQAAFLIASPSAEIERILRQHLEGGKQAGPTRWSIATGQTRQVLRQADAALVASGTATIEAALMRCPMIVVYKAAPLNYLIARMLVKVKHIGMVNLIAGKGICPEFVQADATPVALAEAIIPLLREGPERTAMLDALDAAVESLGPGGAEQRAADIVVAELGGPLTPRPQPHSPCPHT